jgi:hypothetical protein
MLSLPSALSRNIPGVSQETLVYEIQRAAVVASETRGGGITMNYANAGIPVIVKEAGQEALDCGMATIRRNYASSVKNGKLSQAEMDRRLSLITQLLRWHRRSGHHCPSRLRRHGTAETGVRGDRPHRQDRLHLASNTSYLDISGHRRNRLRQRSAVRFQHSQGTAGYERSRGTGCRVAHKERMQASRRAGCAHVAGGGSVARWAVRPEDRPWVVESDENRQPSPDPETALVEADRSRGGIERRAIGREETVGRCIFALVNERAHLLAQGITLRASDIDVLYLTATGFRHGAEARFFYADAVGLETALARIEEFRQRHGDDLWPAAPLLRRFAERGSSFGEFDRHKTGGGSVRTSWTTATILLPITSAVS